MTASRDQSPGEDLGTYDESVGNRLIKLSEFTGLVNGYKTLKAPRFHRIANLVMRELSCGVESHQKSPTATWA